MTGCCSLPVDLCKQFDCKVEEIDGGVCFSFTSDDKKKAEALKSMMKACRDLCGDECCGTAEKSSCC
jgi:hypothetical protein